MSRRSQELTLDNWSAHNAKWCAERASWPVGPFRCEFFVDQRLVRPVEITNCGLQAVSLFTETICAHSLREFPEVAGRLPQGPAVAEGLIPVCC